MNYSTRLKIKLNIFSRILIGCIFFISCAQNNQPFTKEINFSPQNSNTLKIRDWIDSIIFIPLKNSKISVGLPPDRIKIREDHICFLYNPDGSNSVLNIYHSDGEYQYGIYSQYENPEPVQVINDFDVWNDTLFILHGENLSFHSLSQKSKIRSDVTVPDYYSAMVRNRNDFIFFNQVLSHGLQIVGLNGKWLDHKISFENTPTLRSDRFPHFTKMNTNDDHLFYYKYEPVIYKISFNDASYIPFIKMDFGAYEIDENERNTLIHGGKSAHDLDNQLCNRVGKFCFFYNVSDLNAYTFLIFKINRVTYYGLINKRTSEALWFNKIENDSGFPFITNGFGALDVIASNQNSLILAIDSEYIESLRSSVSDQPMASNWGKVKSEISIKSEPVLCILKFK